MNKNKEHHQPLYRILQLCWEYPPTGSGVGQYIESISTGLRALGHYTLIITSRAEGLPEQEDFKNGKLLRIYSPSDIGSKWLADKVLEIAKTEKIDLIEAPERLGEAGVLMRSKQRPPVMINCRYNDVLRQARYSQVYFPWQKVMIQLARIREWKRHLRERYSIEHADLLAAPSRIMMEGLRNQGVKIPEKNAVLPKPLKPLMEWENREAKRPTVLLVGRIDIGKGIGFLPEMIRQVKAEIPNVLFEIAGGDSYARGLGDCRNWLEKQLASEIEYVHFTGHLNRDEVNEAYRRAWVVIVPSKWDTSPTTVLEAMQRRKAIVASPFGGMPEYVEGTGNRIEDPNTPKFASAIVEFLKNEKQRRLVGEAGRQKAFETFLPETCAIKYVEFINQVLNPNS
ncbi:glycosyltransferase family 4 protein [Desulforhopalus sp. 52FAK]